MFSLTAIFTTSLLIGYSGAMAPGPMLTYAIGASARRGFRAGPLIAAGHGLLEIVLVLALALGMASFFSEQWVVSLLAVAGGLVISVMGIRMAQSYSNVKLAEAIDDPHPESRHRLLGAGNLLLGGAIVSLANPYWALWWVGVSAAYFNQLSAHGATGYIAFFGGHILADLTWYGLVAFLVASGRRVLSQALYSRIILASGVFLVILGGAFVITGLAPGMLSIPAAAGREPG